MRTGEVRVSPYLPFGGDNCGLLKASGLTTPKKDWIWLPVCCYLIENPKGRILVDTGWHRDMSPSGEYDKKAQIKSLGSWILYHVNQGRIAAGATSPLLKKITLSGTACILTIPPARRHGYCL